MDEEMSESTNLFERSQKKELLASGSNNWDLAVGTGDRQKSVLDINILVTTFVEENKRKDQLLEKF